jgi:methyltransferase (TIGR00027 family)
MKPKQASATAQAVAATRALESEKPDGVRICNDPLARKFTSRIAYSLIKRFAGYGERRSHGALTFIACRCRYMDDYLRACLQSGTVQVVILGAGLDSRAYRDDLLQENVKVFEVDHPATQTFKINRVEKILGGLPVNVTYVPVDFNTETLDKLLSSGFDASLKTLFIWEGVTQYLTAEAVDATLEWIRLHVAPGSAIIFDYMVLPPPELAPARPERSVLHALLVRLSGETREYGIEKGQIEAFLGQRGFTNVVEADAGRLEHLYCTGPNQGRVVLVNSAIVHAET